MSRRMRGAIWLGLCLTSWTLCGAATTVDVNGDGVFDATDVERVIGLHFDHNVDARALVKAVFGDTSGKTEALRDEAVPAPRRVASDVLMDVPYRGQWDADSGSCNHSNCGPTCVNMILDYYGTYVATSAVRDVLGFCGYTGIDNLYTCGTAFRDDLDYDRQAFSTRSAAQTWLLDMLRAYRPVILLVEAGYLPDRGYTFAGGHFIVVRGVTADGGTVTINDPNNTGGISPRSVYPIDDVMNAWWYEISGNDAMAMFDPGWIPGGVNIAPDAVDAAASSAYGAGYTAWQAIDGDTATKWTTAAGTAPPHWLALDLGTTANLTQYVLRHASTGGDAASMNARHGRIELGTSLQGPWTAHAAFDNAAQEPISVVPVEPPIRARYVRLWIDDPGIDIYARVPEFGVYAEPTPLPTPAPYLAQDGMLVFEAEHDDSRTSVGGKSWVAYNEYRPGWMGDGYLRAEPDTGTVIEDGYVTDAPRLEFRAAFAQAGVYHLWLRMQRDDTSDDTIHAGLDGVGVASGKTVKHLGAAGSWEWTRDLKDGSTASLAIGTPGEYAINLWMCEDGARIDRGLLTLDADYVPSGGGPPESARGPTPPPTATPATTPTATPRSTEPFRGISVY